MKGWQDVLAARPRRGELAVFSGPDFGNELALLLLKVHESERAFVQTACSAGTTHEVVSASCQSNRDL